MQLALIMVHFVP